MNDEEEFSDFHISHKKAKIYELTEQTKYKNALNVKKVGIEGWLSIVRNASLTNNFTDSEFTDIELNRTANNASCK